MEKRAISRGIVLVLGIAMVVSGVIHLLRQPSGEGDTIQIISGSTQKSVALDQIPVESFEGEMRKKVGDPIPHTFEGVALKALLEKEGFSFQEASAVILKSEDNYEVSLTVEEILAEHNAYIVLRMDGEELENIDGKGRAPMLVMLNDEFSTRWARYIQSIEVAP